MAHQAQETFVAETKAGLQRVVKGEVLADSHPLVKLDEGRGHLFKPLDVDGADPAPKAKRPARKTPAAADGPAGPAGWGAAGDDDDGGDDG